MSAEIRRYATRSSPAGCVSVRSCGSDFALAWLAAGRADTAGCARCDRTPRRTQCANSRFEAPAPDYESAFAAMERERAQALVVLEEPINQACRKQIADLAVMDIR